MERLTRQEEDVMRWIWQIEPCFIKDILAKYEASLYDTRFYCEESGT